MSILSSLPIAFSLSLLSESTPSSVLLSLSFFNSSTVLLSVSSSPTDEKNHKGEAAKWGKGSWQRVESSSLAMLGKLGLLIYRRIERDKCRAEKKIFFYFLWSQA